MLLESWAEAAGLRDQLAWMSVERVERDEHRFWFSLVDALARVVESVEPAAPSPGFRGEVAADRLLAGLDSLTNPVVLVIDDVHELRSPDALGWLEDFLSRLPSQVLVVLVTREDPRLGLHRLRLAGALTEVRGSDLRFSLDETRQLLMAEGIALSDTGIALLHERTEGWAAGLRLAVLSLARHGDPERFVREFSGSERTVADYLMAEVLERHPADVREMLLRTICPGPSEWRLADFLTGGSGAERILQQLEHENAFVSSLDASRSWVSLPPPVWPDSLQLELRRVAPASVVPMHRAAAQCVRAARRRHRCCPARPLASDWPDASRLLADNYLDLILDGRVATVRGAAVRIPTICGADPELTLAFSAVRLVGWRTRGERGVRRVCAAVGRRGACRAPKRFEAHLAVTRLALARWRGDLKTVLDAIQSLEAALQALPAGKPRAE